MSVTTNNRGENKFEVLLKTRHLAVYTANITSNTKKFPVEQQWMIERLNDTAVGIFMKCWRANSLYIKDECQKAERLRLQTEAVRLCNDLIAYIYLSHTMFHLEGKRVKYWSDSTEGARELIRKWINSDRKR